MPLPPFLRRQAGVLALLVASSLPAAPAPVELRWLGEAPPLLSSGVSWGVPWPRGAVSRDQNFQLLAGDGSALPLQTWPLAYWPDGSLKWSGFATVAGPAVKSGLRLEPAASSPAAAGVRVRTTETTLEVSTGRLQCRVLRQGEGLIERLSVDGREVARAGRLVCLLQQGPDDDATVSLPRERFVSRLRQVTVEQSGPVRAVLKLEGVHQGAKGGRNWLPFVVRLYFHAGDPGIRLVHTIIFDGDEQRDFIRGLGLEFEVPLREEIQNRHVRFSGEDDGLWPNPFSRPWAGAARSSRTRRPEAETCTRTNWPVAGSRMRLN